MKNIRGKILETATELFETRGINSSGVDTIIAESGIAKSTLYKYFPSKNSLVIAYLKEKSDRFYDWLNTKLEDQRRDSLDVLIELCELVEQWITTPEFHGLPFHIASVEFPDPTHPVHNYSVELSKELQVYLAEIAHKAGIKDSKSLAQQLTIIFEGGALLERLSPGTGAARRAKNASITLVKAASQTK